MSQHFTKVCPVCAHPLRVRTEYVGKKVACKQCSAVFVIQPPETPAGPAAVGARGADLDCLTEENSRLRREHAAALEAVAAESLEREEAQAARADLQRERDALAAALAQAESRSKDAEEDAHRLRAEAESLLRELDTACAQREEDRIRVDEDLLQLRESLKAAEEERDRTREALQTIERLADEARAHASALDAARAQADEQRAALAARLETALRDSEEVAGRLRQLQGEHESLQARVVSLEAELQSVATVSPDLERFRAEAEVHAAAVRAWEEQLATARADLQNALDRNQDLEDQLTPLLQNAGTAPDEGADVARLREALHNQAVELEEMRARITRSESVEQVARNQLLELGIRLP